MLVAMIEVGHEVIEVSKICQRIIYLHFQNEPVMAHDSYTAASPLRNALL
jgi:hypothetical protein